MDLDIVYEDEDLLVINKAAGVPVHPSQGNHGNTLANGLAWYFKEKGEPFVYRAVNCLDRDTTGLMIAAKNMFAASVLSSMAAARQIRREYLAIVLGNRRRAAPSTPPSAARPVPSSSGQWISPPESGPSPTTGEFYTVLIWTLLWSGCA